MRTKKTANRCGILHGLAVGAWLAIWAAAPSAQAQTEAGDLQDAQLTIEKNRVLELAKANRNYDKMTKLERPGLNNEQEYKLPRFNFGLPVLDPTIQPPQLAQEPPLPSYCRYLKAGLGNYGSIFGEGFLSNCTTDSEVGYTVHARHLSQNRGPVDGNNSGTHDTHLKASGWLYTEGGKATASAAYQRNGLFFYGYNPETAGRIRRGDIRQVYNLFEANVGYHTTDREADLQYHGKLNFYGMGDAYRAGEREFNITAGAAAKLGDESTFALDADVSIANRRDLGRSQNRNLLIFTPQYRFVYDDRFRLTLGARLVYQDDTLGGRSNYRFYPVANVSFDIVENTFTAYASLEGTTQKTSLRRFATENPFIGPNVPLAHTNQLWQVAGGLRGNLNKTFGFNLRGAFGNYQNLYFFVNSADSSKFTALYDTRNVPVLNVGGELSYDNAGFRSALKVDFYAYDTKEVVRPWHRPGLVASWVNGYTWNNRLSLGLDLFVIGGLRARTPEVVARTVNLANIVDANFRADFRFTDKLAVFANFANIFNQNYQRYLYYPSRQFQVLAGITLGL
ncbi:MAG: hypothetical protein MUC97_13055 [Bernardetiaceae bacterium]|jgi:hypothetical protein|nr:hypothetical protein [Bernardetiaceae bacterium]